MFSILALISDHRNPLIAPALGLKVKDVVDVLVVANATLITCFLLD